MTSTILTKWLTCYVCGRAYNSDLVFCPFCAREKKEMEKVKPVCDKQAMNKFATGAAREDKTGKGRMDLLTPWAIEEVSRVFENGIKNHSERNWENGIPLHSFIDSGLRHALKFMRGDKDEPHLAMACWNFLCCLDTLKRIEKGLLPNTLKDIPPDHLT